MSSTPRSSEELTIIYRGASVSDLSQMFDLTPQEVNRRIVGKVVPVTAAHRTPRYKVREAAPYLCNVVFDVEEFLKDLPPSKLPPKLQDAFWKAQNSRQEFEQKKGDLWSTDRVIEIMSDVFKVIRMTALMFGETVAQQTELSPRQREILQELGDGLLETAHQKLVAEFADRVAASDEHGRVLDEELEPALIVQPAEEPEFDDGFGD